MIRYVFGAPGAGKSTYLAKVARKYIRKGVKVYCNFPLHGTYLIDAKDLGYYDFSNSVILLDECGIDFNNRDFKSGLMNDKQRLQFFKLIRHYHADAYVASQSWSDIDKKIRDLSTEYYLIRKGLIFRFLTVVKPIYKKCDIDDVTHQPIDYYVFGLPTSWRFVFRPIYYKDFDSFDAPVLPPNKATLTLTR